jgi:pentatricopeptide repeat protein
VALDRSKVLETAQKHLAKGNYDKAIAEYQKLVREDPNDVRTWLKIGDLYTRKGARQEACDTYLKVASHYSSQGFFRKVVALYKQVLKLDPSRLDVSLKLAEVYEQLQLVSEALATYEQVAAAYARQGDVDKALETLAKMCELDPDNIPVRIKYAEMLSKANRTEEAADAFAEGAELLKEQGRMDDYAKVAERLVYHRPGAVDVARDLAEYYISRGDSKRALAKLQVCFKADPKNVETLDLLARAFEILGQTPKTISVYKEIARIHQEAGREREQAVTLRRILELDPGDAEARQALASHASTQASRASEAGVPASAVVQSQAAPAPEHDDEGPRAAEQAASEPAQASAPASQVPEEDLEMVEDDELLESAELIEPDEGDVVILDDEGEEAPAAADGEAAQPTAESGAHRTGESGAKPLGHTQPPAETRPPPEGTREGSGASLPPDASREAEIARLLTECDVFLRYGLKQKVIAQLEKIVGLDPTHVEARERLKDSYIEVGNMAAAVEQLEALAQLFENEKPQLAQLYRNQVHELAPSGLEPSEVTAGGAAEPQDDEVLFVDEEDSAGAPDIDVDIDADMEMPASANMSPEPAEAEPTADAGLEPMTPQEFEAAPVSHPTETEEAASAAERASQPPGEIEEVLDEAEFFMAQGLWEEARSTIQETLGSHPNHPLLLDKLQEVAEASGQAATAGVAPQPSDEVGVFAPPQADGGAPRAEDGAPQAEPSAPEAAEPAQPMPATPAAASFDDTDLSAMPDQSFELAEKLAEELVAEEEVTSEGSEQLDVEAVFQQFKRGIEETVGDEDAETHFDLGIAYKEMGLVRDAIGEFEKCLSNPERECMAHTMIGICHLEQGHTEDAIGAFKKGLYSEHKTDGEELGLYFELGRAYELAGDSKEALFYYQKVQRKDPSFRGVEERIKALSDPDAVDEPEDPSASMDDVDRAFDDLLREG